MEDAQSESQFFDDYKSHVDLIYKYIYLRVGKSRETAEDLTQDTFLKAYVNLNKFNSSKASFKTWLFKIARNTVIDWYRLKKIHTVDIENAEMYGKEESMGELTEYLITRINIMAPIERDVILYKYIYEFSDKEIALIIKKSNIATRVLISRSIKKLKKLTETKI